MAFIGKLMTSVGSCSWHVQKKTVLLPGDLKTVDGSDLGAPMEVIMRVVALSGSSCTKDELQRTARCAAEVLLQTAPWLFEVRAGYKARVWVLRNQAKFGSMYKADVPAHYLYSLLQAVCWLSQLFTHMKS